MLWLHGIGKAICSSRGAVDWGTEAEDYDAVEFISFLYMPLIPLRAVHVAIELNRETPERFHHPIRLRWRAVGVAFLRRWFWGFLLVGLLGAINPANWDAQVISVVFGSLLVGCFGLVWLGGTDQRRREIRYLLGRHRYGSSDPVDWPPDRFGDTPSPGELYGTETFGEAIPKLLKGGEFSRAMWAARLCVVFEDARAGENWSDAILAHPGVQEALERVKRNPGQWHAAMVGA